MAVKERPLRGNGAAARRAKALIAWALSGLVLFSGRGIAQGYANPDLLVETSWLAGDLADPNLLIVDMREPADFARAHVPGAVNLPVSAIVANVDGVPFERRASGDADCPHARAAIEWLTNLGQRTVHHTAPLEVAEGLERLVRRFAEIYRLGATEREFLGAQIAAIAGSGEPFPLVFQHGDPGTWNAMVTPSGRVAFLDWEAAEPAGMPLWDVFYFIHTYGAWSLRAATSGDVTKGFGGQFLAGTALQSVLVEATARYCARVGVSEQLIEPLFYLCWMHRDLKEATRLAPGALARGHYLNVLRASIERRDALQALFSLAALV